MTYAPGRQQGGIVGRESEWTDAEVRAAVAHRNAGNLIHLDLGTSHTPEADWQALLESVR